MGCRKPSRDPQNTQNIHSLTHPYSKCLCSVYYISGLCCNGGEGKNNQYSALWGPPPSEVCRHTMTEPNWGVSNVCRRLEGQKPSVPGEVRGGSPMALGSCSLSHRFSCAFTSDAHASSHFPAFFHNTGRFSRGEGKFD